MNKKELSRLKRHRRIRIRMRGNEVRPRLVLKRSLNNLSAPVIDDTQDKVLLSFSSAHKDFRQKVKNAGNVKSAEEFANFFASKAKEKGITKIVFDRAGYLYHGRIKAFAESLRKNGMEF